MEAPPSEPAVALDWDALARELDQKSPLEIMDHVSMIRLLYSLHQRTPSLILLALWLACVSRLFSLQHIMLQALRSLWHSFPLCAFGGCWSGTAFLLFARGCIGCFLSALISIHERCRCLSCVVCCVGHCIKPLTHRRSPLSAMRSASRSAAQRTWRWWSTRT